jgi:hypothetical protein
VVAKSVLEMLKVWADKVVCLYTGLQVGWVGFKLQGLVKVTLHNDHPVFDASRPDSLLHKLL